MKTDVLLCGWRNRGAEEIRSWKVQCRDKVVKTRR